VSDGPAVASLDGPAVAAPVARERGGLVVTAVAAIATALVLLALGILPFLTPAWIHAAQDRAQADAWTGWPTETVRAVTGSVLHDLILGPPEFAQTVDGVPVFDAAEIGHLRDVRTVLLAFAAVVSVAAVALVASWWAARGSSRFWRGVRFGGANLAIIVVGLGLFAAVSFDTAFELFHQLLFPQGTYTFDPATERLVQLFPEAFWFDTAIALGVVLVALGVGAVAIGTWRLRRLAAARPAPTTSVVLEGPRP
jgi:integral membrane protein (TIGR01906 family)